MRILDVTTCSVADGSGFRLVIWCSGCSHQCVGCHNPESWDWDNGHKLTDEMLDTILDQLELPYIHGVTFSGGDPLYDKNIEQVYRLCKIIKENHPDKTVWLYTGYKFEEIFKTPGYYGTQNVDPVRECRHEILKYIDVLVDGEFVHDRKNTSIAFRGSDNQRIIDVSKSLKQCKAVLYEQE